MNKEELSNLILETVNKYSKTLTDKQIDLSLGEKAPLFGGGGPLDSLELVALIVEIEEAIENKTGSILILADEKAVSRRVSPFARLDLLIDYTYEVLKSE